MKNFGRECGKIRSLVEKANNTKEAQLETSHDRFHFFSENNDKGLFSFGIYDYATKKHEIVDVFDTDAEDRVNHMRSMLTDLTENDK